MNEKWFAMSVEEIEKKLKTNAASGLSQKAAVSRCQEKKELFFKVKKKPWNKLLLDFFGDFFLVMLLLIAVFSLFFKGDAIIGGATLVLIGINLGLSYFFYYRDTKSVESATAFFMPTARVIRGGRLYICDYKDVVEGDVILIEKGDMIGCDARLVHSDSLCVSMKLDKKNEKLLQKFAGGLVESSELYAENMANMIHAGSTVKAGSGRAIVVATGEYTYLGAKIGGITHTPSCELPEGLVSLKKKSSKIGMMLLLLTLPFCIFSLLFGHFTGSTVLLSNTLLIALSVGATAMLARTTNLFIGFFAKFTRKAALSDDPCIIRSLKAFDDMAGTDYLFMLDGSIATDGILHFNSIITMDGESDRLDSLSQNGLYLREVIGLYTLAKNGALSVSGVGSGNSIDSGIDEFIKYSKVDLAALRIRYKIHSFLPSVDREGSDAVDFFVGDERKTICVSLGSSIIGECTSAVFGGVAKPLTDEGRATIINSFENCVARGKKAVVFATKDKEKLCFAGILVLCEGVDPTFEKALNNLRRSGVKVIAFSNCVGRGELPEVPDLLRRGERACSGDFLKNGLPISYNFGKYDEYYGFSESMIGDLAKYVKSQNKVLAVMSFSDYAHEAIERADVFISCAPVRTELGGRIFEEIRSLEIPGEQSSASCTQQVKAEADILLMRPVSDKGGLEPLAKTIEYCKVAYRNLKNYVYYLIVAQMMRVISIVLPMLVGYSSADIRQILYLGFVFDLMAMLIFMNDSRKTSENRRKMKEEIEAASLLDILRSNKNITISAIVGSALSVFLPRFFAMLGVFGKFYYKAEFSFVSLLLLQLLLLVCVYAKDLRNKGALLRLVNDLSAQICAGTALIFTLLCFVTPIGRFFGIIETQFSYFLLAFVPTIAFFICFVALNAANEKKSAKKRRKNVNKL